MNFLTELRAIGIPENIILKIHNHFEGSPCYVPKVTADLPARNAQIYRDFNGKNVFLLVKKYKLCYQQIHKIIARERGRK